MNCPHCDEPIKGMLHFCPSCGTELPKVEVSQACPHCGEKINSRTSFCPSCGELISGEKPARKVVIVRQKVKRPPALKPPGEPGFVVKAPPRPGDAALLTPKAAPARAASKPGVGPARPGAPKPAGGQRRPATESRAAAPEAAAPPLPKIDSAGRPAAGAEGVGRPKAAAPTPPVVESTGRPATGVPREGAPAAGAPLPPEDAVRPRGPMWAPPQGEPPPGPAARAASPTRPTRTEDGAPRPAPRPDLFARPGPAPDTTVRRPPEGEPFPPRPVPSEEAVRPRVEVVDKYWADLRADAAREETARPDIDFAALRERLKRPWRWLALVGLVTLVVLVALLFVGPDRGGLALRGLPGPLARSTRTPTPTNTAGPSATPTLRSTQTPESPTPAPTATGPAPQQTAVPVMHTVAAGETLQSIAERYGLTVAEIMQANSLWSQAIQAGQELLIPLRPVLHTVQQGENLVTIAQAYGMPVADLMAANEISDANLLKVGQQLFIPARSAAPTPAPTEAVTPTPEPTATPTAQATPTVGLLFPAPSLLSPANGETIGDAEVAVSWTSVGLLADDTWYVLTCRRDETEAPAPPAIWTRSTTSRIDAAFRPKADATSHRFYWSVTVMRSREGEAAVAVSPPSEERWFDWQ